MSDDENYAAETTEPDAHRDTLLGVHMSGMSEETGGSVRAEMARREAAGLPAVPEMPWED